MKRIILGFVTIVGAVSAVSLGATGAFFSDTETSTGNTFAAGAIDLLVDNESYYNGNVCAETAPESGVWQWQGNNLYPVPGTPCTTSWDSTNLGQGHLFFNFTDIKPDDEGEDTISLEVQNEAWACMDITLTSNDDTSSTEPELEALDQPEDGGNIWDGELAQAVQMIWWADDGDNVLEVGENIFVQPNALANFIPGDGAARGTFSIALADSQNNVWGTQGPLPVGTSYIAKAWCFGDISAAPVAAGTGQNPSIASGITCDGINLGNITQTDAATLDIGFSAVQARNNPNFLCATPEQCAFSTDTPGPNLVTNGGFEDPIVATPQLWNIYGSVAGGWTVEWRDAGTTSFGNQVRPNPAHLELHRGVLGAANGGQQYGELDTDWGGPTDGGTGEPASVRIYQDIPTIIGAQYRIRYAFAPRPNTVAGENNLEVRWGGSVADTEGPVGDADAGITWNTFEVVVQATTTTTRVQFTDLGTSNSLGTFLDDVSVEQISCALPV